MKRGDVVEVDWPFSDLSGTKPRPAIVVQADFLNSLLDSGPGNCAASREDVNYLIAKCATGRRRAGFRGAKADRSLPAASLRLAVAL
jgi:hypothetical protein